ncbi:ribonuclease HII [Schinkia azotoformans]|uniref:Ribonuclease HII n=1 Tax=Schinkia azotoformans LMG 9581 TaxID=1131731 RepID=K6DSV7_SCHAZ|nr:ribonuclease HII [Schinkia azotoformans]EKN63866.1 ribonuclease HII [Schinkia azotoformans LMG 9581]MEC1638270.1 ribonuclease HII [Schinkia azotoformans]MEC1946296.1 ribonuclease HII [Schinkia azotoformans]
MTKTIKEIEEIFRSSEDFFNEEFLAEVKSDKRKGVQLLYSKWLKNKAEEKKLKDKFEQMSIYENELRHQHIHRIAGVDEVGRGPLAGPVVCAAVILGEKFFLPGINDSKAISEKKRELFYEYIIENAMSVGIGSASAIEIDELNIYQATKLAMTRAIKKLEISPEYLLIDAMELPLSIPQKSIIKGDAKSISIAASSVVAKVTRDRYMKELGKKYPQYGFESHMGYGTSQHLQAIEKYGVIEEHRRSFAPVKDLFQLV